MPTDLIAESAPTLAGLLAPCGLEDFADRYWERDWLHLTGRPPDGYEGLLDPSELDRLIAFHRHHAIPPFSLAEGGAVRPQAAGSSVRDAAQAVRSGETILVGALHERWPPAARLCSALAAELRQPVGCTLVVSPPDAQGLRSHFDAADVFVLQLAGRKTWRIGKPDRLLPLAGDPLASSATLSDEAATIEVMRGDLLYVPRGFPHVAFTTPATFSAHISVYVDTLRWRDAVARALDLAAERDLELRRGLPLGALGTSGSAALADGLRARVAAAFASVAADEVIDTMAAELIRAMPPLPDAELRQAVAGPDVTVESSVTRRAGALCLTRVTASQATIDFPGASLTGPAALGPALEHVARHERFRVADLPGLSADSQVVLVRRLVVDGLLKLADGSGDGTSESRAAAAAGRGAQRRERPRQHEEQRPQEVHV